MKEKFAQLWQRAAERKGGDSALESLLAVPLSQQELLRYDDSDYLSAFSKKVFQSGFVWRVVENKWANFEELFFNFEIDKVLMMSDEMLEQRSADKRIIRNVKKVWTIRENALMISDFQESHGSFTQLIAEWPSDDIIGLWDLLKKRGSRLGGNTGPYALRSLGVDTFLLSRDVEAYLRHREIITGGLTSKSSLKAIQAMFNDFQQESGLSLTTLSQLISYSTGDNFVGIRQE